MEGRIYKITSPQTDKVYIGSTSQTLELRFRKHKASYKCSNRSTTAIEILCYDDCKIELVEEIVYNDIKELRTKEGQYIRDMREQAVNKCIAGRSQKEYIDTNREKINTNRRAYIESNREKINTKNKAYYDSNIDKIKAYREANKDRINARRRELRALKKKQA